MTTLDNVLEIEIERAWTDGIEAIGESYDTAEEIRARWVRIGLGLLAGRQKCPANQEFGAWVERTRYGNISRDERQCAMWLAVNAAVVMPALRETRIENPERARRHIRENLPLVYEQCQEVRSFTDMSVNAATNDIGPESGQGISVEPVEPLSPDPASTFSGSEIEPAPPKRTFALASQGNTVLKDPGSTKLAKLFDFPGDQITRVMEGYPPARQNALRAELAKLPKISAVRMFELALKVAESGVSPEIQVATKRLDPRMFWPHLPAPFCKVPLGTMNLAQLDRARVKLSAIDAKVAEMLLADQDMAPARIHAVVWAIWNGTEPDAAEPSRPVRALPAIPETSKIKHVVKFCGEVIWPRPSWCHVGVTDADVIEGWNLINLWTRRLEIGMQPEKPREVAVCLRLLTKDIEGAGSLQGLVTVMRECLAAYDKADGDKTDSMTPGRQPKHADR